ncbi:bifunctional 2-polyprenyl-6-hydroxyphenol methylase/3-demethylubiquinol 3-O-methyltransferase UbiG [Neptunicella sp. SCSIO 80796]|uniref:bifunctional 2-polyprenyl-6-hydroxyphenol methylase/3-demethylubiquinol 3-O-methyltransferase UbiG n=1 Tax=Neptunicella plasticusilytica TaxID=3117012 RepID=UPI003A4E5C1A
MIEQRNQPENVDPAEIEKFSALASRWWDLEGEFKPLHQINPLRLDYIAGQANGLFGKTVLDVGCGGGILAESMARMGAKVTAIDMAKDSLSVAKLHGLESGVTVDYQHSTAEQYADQHAGQFDIVTCLEMLEHVPEPQSVVNACEKLVKPGGLVFFSTLNRNMKSWLMAIVAAEKIFKLVPDGTHQHDKFIKPSELLGWLDQTSLYAKNMTGLHMNPLSRQYYLSDHNVDVNYLMVCQKQV